MSGEIFGLEELLATAARRTGLTEEQLREEWGKLEEPAPRVDAKADPRVIARSRMIDAGVPLRFIKAVCDSDPVEGHAMETVRAWWESGKWCLVMSGTPGTMKTGSACWALGQRDGGIFVKSDELLPIALEDKAKFLRLKTAPLIILDDLGTEIADPKGYWTKTFNSLLDDWYARCARVIMTCNQSAEQFKRNPNYGERVIDRIRDNGTFVEIQGVSVRGKK